MLATVAVTLASRRKMATAREGAVERVRYDAAFAGGLRPGERVAKTAEAWLPSSEGAQGRYLRGPARGR